MSIFDEKIAFVTLLVFISQGHAYVAEDAHLRFFKWASSMSRWVDGHLHKEPNDKDGSVPSEMALPFSGSQSGGSAAHARAACFFKACLALEWKMPSKAPSIS